VLAGGSAQAQRHWRRLDGRDLLPKIILDVKCGDGIDAKSAAEPKKSHRLAVHAQQRR
jgi:hypothetical protein